MDNWPWRTNKHRTCLHIVTLVECVVKSLGRVRREHSCHSRRSKHHVRRGLERSEAAHRSWWGIGICHRFLLDVEKRGERLLLNSGHAQLLLLESLLLLCFELSRQFRLFFLLCSLGLSLGLETKALGFLGGTRLCGWVGDWVRKSETTRSIGARWPSLASCDNPVTMESVHD